MKQFFIGSLIVSAFVYIGATIYSSTFIPFNWIDKGGIIFFWGMGVVVSAGIQVIVKIEKMIKEDEKKH